MKLQELREKLLSQPSQPPEMKEVISGIWRMSEERTSGNPESLESAGPAPRNPETTEIVLTAAEGDYQRPLMTTGEPLWVPNSFAKRIEELSALLESIEALGQSTANGLELLKIFEAQMEQLASTLEPVKAFCSKLEQLAVGFEPMGIVHEQIVGIMAEFRAQLLQLANLVEPAVALRLRATELAKALEPVDDLAAQFARLAGVFRVASQREGAPKRDAGRRSL
jgi:hypothetical protein